MSSSSTASSDKKNPPVTPQVLTRNIIPTLTKGLDASDVLECYALIRKAPLHGVANSTLKISKMALGLRFRPALAGAGVRNKRPLELTLEYGPQRIGPSLHHESMPFIQTEETSAFISWENVGKVYYTTRISSEVYTSANFMASMTGAVLNTILLEAVNYADKRRRYQPFAVYSSEKRRELKSSSSSDFTEYMWKHLADLGVEVEPILVPPVYEARLWVEGISRVVPEPDVAHEAATFYQKLYQCIEAIAYGDFSAYMPTGAPTFSSMPTVSPTEAANETLTPSLAPSVFESVAQPLHISNSSSRDEANGKTAESNSTADNVARSHEGNNAKVSNMTSSTTAHDEMEDDLNSSGGDESDSSDDGDESEIDESDTTDEGGPDRFRRRLDEDDVDSSSYYPSAAPSDLGSSEVTDEDEDVDKAKKAAEEAQAKANEAKEAAQTEGDTKAADAAQAAADAAQKAADATSNAAAQAQKDGLLSGDGDTMSAIISTCFSNPKYDIASVDENGTVQAPAFLYRDGSLYYKLNLTSPYFDVVKVERSLPKARTFGGFESGGDIVDWTLAMVVLFSVLLGTVVLLQQIGYHFFGPLYKCQRWFFNPRSGQKSEYDEARLERQQEFVFTFGEDGIPLSMGGRRSSSSPIAPKAMSPANNLFNHRDLNETLGLPDLDRPSHSLRDGSIDIFGEIELQPVSNGKRRLRSDSKGSYDSGMPSADNHVGPVPERLTRDPDLVDLPHLKSRSKVAVPVGCGSDQSVGSMDDYSM